MRIGLRVAHINRLRPPAPNDEIQYIFFFYKHNVYKHIEAEILHLFKHNAKHIPASDFGYVLVYWYIGKYI